MSLRIVVGPKELERLDHKRRESVLDRWDVVRLFYTIRHLRKKLEKKGKQ